MKMELKNSIAKRCCSATHYSCVCVCVMKLVQTYLLLRWSYASVLHKINNCLLVSVSKCVTVCVSTVLSIVILEYFLSKPMYYKTVCCVTQPWVSDVSCGVYLTLLSAHLVSALDLCHPYWLQHMSRCTQNWKINYRSSFQKVYLLLIDTGLYLL